MDVDLRSSTVTFHVVFTGPGKIDPPQPANAARKDGHGGVSLFVAGDDRVTVATCDASGRDALLGLRVELQAVLPPAKAKAAAVERLLLSAADAVVFIPDDDAARSKRALSQLLAALEKAGRDPDELTVLVRRSSNQEMLATPAGSKWGIRDAVGETATLDDLGAAMEAAVKGLIDRYRGLEETVGAEQGRGVLAVLSNTGTTEIAAIGRARLDRWIALALVAGGAAAAVAAAFLAV